MSSKVPLLCSQTSSVRFGPTSALAVLTVAGVAEALLVVDLVALVDHLLGDTLWHALGLGGHRENRRVNALSVIAARRMIVMADLQESRS